MEVRGRGEVRLKELFYFICWEQEWRQEEVASGTFFPDILWIETPGRRGKKYWGFTGIFYGNVLSLLEMGKSWTGANIVFYLCRIDFKL